MVGIRGSRDQHWWIVRAIAVAPEWPDRERFLRLVHGCAGAAGVFRPARHDLVLCRDDIEPLRTVFADHMHRGAAARASGIFRFDANLNPRQVLGGRARCAAFPSGPFAAPDRLCPVRPRSLTRRRGDYLSNS